MTMLAACQQPGPFHAAEESASGEGRANPAPQAGGQVIDTASALSPSEERAIADRLAKGRGAGGRNVVLVTLTPTEGDSMEGVGWAVGGSGATDRPILLLVDPAGKQVRIEGDLTAESRAAIASAMQADLRAGQVAVAVNAGLDRLERLAP